MSEARYAIYFAPAPESPLWSFGSSVLGYDAATGQTRPPLAPEGFSAADWMAMTAQPRRYGFHATLKAPFRLAEGSTEDDLIETGRAFARRQKSFTLPRLEVATLDSFVALSPAEDAENLEKLAGASVEAFEPLRAPLSADDLARRLLAPLADRQKAALERWGYPYVFDDFHFHMTLTGSLPPETIGSALDGLAALYAAHVGDAGTTVDAVTLYVQDTPAADFRIVDRFVFGAA